jgi:hypothetical protein
MEEVLITTIVFAGIYQIIKAFTDFLLKRKLIIKGNIDKAGILEETKDLEENSYPTLKWGLVTLFGGLGLLTIAMIDRNGLEFIDGRTSYLSVGIELIAISIGFLLYFFIVRMIKK